MSSIVLAKESHESPSGHKYSTEAKLTPNGMILVCECVDEESPQDISAVLFTTKFLSDINDTLGKLAHAIEVL